MIAASIVFAPSLAAKKKKEIPRVVTGAVLDESDNPIVGASVVLTDLETGKKRAIYTQEGGIYEFADIQETRNYEVQATFRGLISQVRKVSMFDNRKRIVLNLQIPPPREEETPKQEQ